MKIKDDIIDELLEQHQPGEDLFGSEGLVSKLTKRLMERILEAEMSNHLGYERGDRTTAGKSGNTRNGRSPKRVKTLHGELQLDVPRDRDSSFEPQIVRKHQRRLKGFDDRVLSLYSRGMTVREIQGHLEELYQVEVSPELISQATHAVWEDIQAWRNRPLQAVWPIVYLDALVVRVRHEGVVTRKSVYLAIGVNLDGTKEALGPSSSPFVVQGADVLALQRRRLAAKSLSVRRRVDDSLSTLRDPVDPDFFVRGISGRVQVPLVLGF